MGDVAKFALRFEQKYAPGGPIDTVVEMVSTFHVRAEEDYSLHAGRLAGLNAAVSEWWQVGDEDWPAARTFFTGMTHLLDITARMVWPVEGVPVVGTLFSDNAGTDTGGGVPPQCALLVSLRGVTSSRRTRGRVFLPPPPAQHVGALGDINIDEGQTYEDARLIMPALAAAIRRFDAPEGEDGPCVLVVWSRMDLDAQAVTHFRMSKTLATQRRRAWPVRPYLDVGLSGEPA